jgi:hypothetical protein
LFDLFLLFQQCIADSRWMLFAYQIISTSSFFF